MSLSGKKQMVIDTDCGVDDALALLMAITHLHEWEIMAITTCAGNTTLDNVTQNVLRVLKCFETQIPVYRGADRPLIGGKLSRAPVHFMADGFGGVADQFPLEDDGIESIPPIPAAIRLTQLVHEHPGDLTLVALGPLTNLALALRLDPSFTSHLRQLVIMGGNTHGKGNLETASEFNFGFDPEAAHVVLSEAACPITLVPLETCREHGLPWSWYDRWLQIDTVKAHFARSILEQPVKRFRNEIHVPKFCCCDLLAMSCVLYPELVVQSKAYHARIELVGQLTRGMLVLDRRPPSTLSHPQPSPNVTLIKSLNLELLQDIYIKLLVQ